MSTGELLPHRLTFNARYANFSASNLTRNSSSALVWIPLFASVQRSRLLHHIANARISVDAAAQRRTRQANPVQRAAKKIEVLP